MTPCFISTDSTRDLWTYRLVSAVTVDSSSIESPIGSIDPRSPNRCLPTLLFRHAQYVCLCAYCDDSLPDLTSFSVHLLMHAYVCTQYHPPSVLIRRLSVVADKTAVRSPFFYLYNICLLPMKAATATRRRRQLANCHRLCLGGFSRLFFPFYPVFLLLYRLVSSFCSFRCCLSH